MKLVLGLGNPGVRYAGTRHNAGSLAVRFCASQRGIDLRLRSRLKAWTGDQMLPDAVEKIRYCVPDTYMNLSGQAAAALIRESGADPEKDLLVVVDDTALDFGRLRLRYGGSSGGHNGLKSIEETLATPCYARLRIGVGTPPERVALENYVLQRFSEEERKALEPVCLLAEKAVEAWLTLPRQAAMSSVNGLTI